MEILKYMSVMIEYPLLAALPAITFGILFFVSKKRFVRVAAISWFVYLPYEYAMKFRILCSDECNIRIDLLLIYPALLVISFVGLVYSIKAVYRKGRSRK